MAGDKPSLVSSSFKGLHNDVVAETASSKPAFSCPSTARGCALSPTDLKALEDTDEGGKQTYIWITSQRLGWIAKKRSWFQVTTCVCIHILGSFESLLLLREALHIQSNGRNSLQNTAAALKVSETKKHMAKAQTDLLLAEQPQKCLSPVPAKSLYTYYLSSSARLKRLTDIP